MTIKVIVDMYFDTDNIYEATLLAKEFLLQSAFDSRRLYKLKDYEIFDCRHGDNDQEQGKSLHSIE